MKLRTLGLAALMTMLTGVASNSASASEEDFDAAITSESASTDVEEFNAEDPTAAPFRPGRPGWDRRGRGAFVCYARNIRGRTFAAWGNFRTPPRFVQRRALDQCRYRSGVLRFSCRSLGCRR